MKRKPNSSTDPRTESNVVVALNSGFDLGDGIKRASWDFNDLQSQSIFRFMCIQSSGSVIRKVDRLCNDLASIGFSMSADGVAIIRFPDWSRRTATRKAALPSIL